MSGTPPTLNDLQYEALKAHLVKFDADDSAPDYIGLHINADATDAEAGWVIYKFTYSGSNVTIVQKKRGTWDGRVALFS